MPAEEGIPGAAALTAPLSPASLRMAEAQGGAPASREESGFRARSSRRGFPAAVRAIPLGPVTIFNLSSLPEGAFSPVPAARALVLCDQSTNLFRQVKPERQAGGGLSKLQPAPGASGGPAAMVWGSALDKAISVLRSARGFRSSAGTPSAASSVITACRHFSPSTALSTALSA